jgi:hypothetical protein
VKKDFSDGDAADPVMCDIVRGQRDSSEVGKRVGSSAEKEGYEIDGSDHTRFLLEISPIPGPDHKGNDIDSSVCNDEHKMQRSDRDP